MNDTLDQANYEDMLRYAQQLAKQTQRILPIVAQVSKERLAQWVSENDPAHQILDESGDGV